MSRREAAYEPGLLRDSHDAQSNLLGDLIQLRIPIRAGARQVESMPALHADRVELTGHDVTNVLQKLLSGEINGDELGLWAEALAARLGRGVHVPPAEAERVIEVVQHVANAHARGGVITTEQAADFLQRSSESAT